MQASTAGEWMDAQPKGVNDGMGCCILIGLVKVFSMSSIH